MQKTLKRLSFLLPAILLWLSGCGQDSVQPQGETAAPQTDLSWEVEAFQFTDQNGALFGLTDLSGKVWLADFIFTSCETVCPPMTAHMANLQKQLKEKGLSVPIVSFSVDPEVDTPEKLKAFGEKFNADFSTWRFLTGYPLETIQRLAKNSFKTIVDKPEGTNQVMHATSFYLIDAAGRVVKRFDGVDPKADAEIIREIEARMDSGGNESSDTAALVDQPIQVDIRTEPAQLKAGETVGVQALVTQGDNRVNDADEVLFELWQEGAETHEKLKGSLESDGLYTAAVRFDVPGTYNIVAHVTARGMHTMPKKSLTVGE